MNVKSYILPFVLELQQAFSIVPTPLVLVKWAQQNSKGQQENQKLFFDYNKQSVSQRTPCNKIKAKQHNHHLGINAKYSRKQPPD